MNKQRTIGSSEKLTLVLNGGSTSLKFALFSERFECIVRGKAFGFGTSNASYEIVTASGSHFQEALGPQNLQSAIEGIARWLNSFLKGQKISAIGHRFVHGGPKYGHHCTLTPHVMRDLKKAAVFDSQHVPDQIKIASFFIRHFPHAVHAACFDTGFHHDLPQRAQMLPIPEVYFTRGVRRFGFHGISCAYLMQELEKIAGAKAANGRIIIAHLGGGSSVTAIHHKKSQDTSMSFSSTSGVPMGTRSGDLDPMLAWYFFKEENISQAAFREMVSKKSGLFGLSGGISDMRELLNRRMKDSKAKIAVEIFCYQLRKCIASMVASLGGMDTLIFSGGIGENNPCIRYEICDSLTFLGVKLSKRLNNKNAPNISSPASKVVVRVIPTDEELEIARVVIGEK